MTVAYWVLGGVLALFYVYSGGIKVVRSRDALRPMMVWVDDVPLGLVRTIGVLEVLGALGLVLPPLTGVLPGLALVAAVGLVLLQLAALGFHVSRHERANLWLNGVLIVLAAVVAGLGTVWV